jgi:hypothetical protein
MFGAAVGSVYRLSILFEGGRVTRLKEAAHTTTYQTGDGVVSILFGEITRIRKCISVSHYCRIGEQSV